MKKIISSICLIALLFSCQTQSKQENIETQTDVQKLAEAYEKQDGEVVVAIGDTLIGTDDPHNIAIPYAVSLASLGNYEKALAVLDHKLVYKPDDYYLYETKANIYTVMGLYDSAMENYEKVIEMKPTYARPYINEGMIYERLDYKDHAIRNYMAALRLFAMNNFVDEVFKFGQKILELDSTNVEAKEIMEQFSGQKIRRPQHLPTPYK